MGCFLHCWSFSLSNTKKPHVYSRTEILKTKVLKTAILKFQNCHKIYLFIIWYRSAAYWLQYHGMIILQSRITPKIFLPWKRFFSLNLKIVYIFHIIRQKACRTSVELNWSFSCHQDFWVLRKLSTAEMEYCGSWVTMLIVC